MNNIEIVVDNFESYKKYEQWLFSIELFESVQIVIFCIENSTSYFYKTKLVNNKWLVITD